MRDLNLVLVFLLVSCLSMVFQVLALARLAAQQNGSRAEELAAGGYIRTVACRVLAATVYVAVAAVQLTGSGTLSVEALIVFTSVQLIWITNSLLDIRIRRTLSIAGGLMPEERRQLARIATVAEDLDKLLDKLFENVAELKVILARAETKTPHPRQESP